MRCKCELWAMEHHNCIIIELTLFVDKFLKNCINYHPLIATLTKERKVPTSMREN